LHAVENIVFLMSSHLIAKMREPVWTFLRLMARRPKWVLARYTRLCRRQGIDRSVFVLSLDCDTDRDFGVAEAVHRRLGDLGIVPVYAVRGQLLEQGAAVYRKFAQQGAEFINHGYASHSSYHASTGTYESTLSYEKLSREEILQDIRKGHQSVQDIAGAAPAGFRTPHFGHFQSEAQLRFLHASLQRMGYAYSTSTVPLYGFRYGPRPEVLAGLHEIPVSGCFDYPQVIPDSWSFRFAPGRLFKDGDFLEQVKRLAAFFGQPGRGGILNFYADPSQVFDWPEFFEAMKLLAPWSVGSYRALLNV